MVLTLRVIHISFYKKIGLNMPAFKFTAKIYQRLFFVLLFLLLSVSSILPQSKNNFADSISAVLQKKLLLDNSQKLEVKKILINYINQPESETSISNAHNKISNLLDKRQKAKFDIIKKEWWQTINNKRKSVNRQK